MGEVVLRQAGDRACRLRRENRQSREAAGRQVQLSAGRAGAGAGDSRTADRRRVSRRRVVADLAAFTFLEDVLLKQSLLAEPDIRARVTRTIEALRPLAAALRKSHHAAAPADPSMN